MKLLVVTNQKLHLSAKHIEIHILGIMGIRCPLRKPNSLSNLKRGSGSRDESARPDFMIQFTEDAETVNGNSQKL